MHTSVQLQTNYTKALLYLHTGAHAPSAYQAHTNVGFQSGAQETASWRLLASCTRASWSAVQDAAPPEPGPQLALAPLPGPLSRSSLGASSWLLSIPLPKVLWCPGAPRAAPHAPSEPAAPAARVLQLLAAASRVCLSAAPRLCACPSADRCAALHSASELSSRAAGARAASVSGRRPGELVAAPASAPASSSSSASLSLPVLTDSAGLPKWCSSVLALPFVSLAWEQRPTACVYTKIRATFCIADTLMLVALPLWHCKAGTRLSSCCIRAFVPHHKPSAPGPCWPAHGPGATRLLGRLGLCEVPGASASEPDSDSEGGRSMAAM